MRFILIVSLLALGACGADGPPIRPNFGLSIGPDGIKPTASVSTKAGPVDVTVGL